MTHVVGPDNPIAAAFGVDGDSQQKALATTGTLTSAATPSRNNSRRQ